MGPPPPRPKKAKPGRPNSPKPKVNVSLDVFEKEAEEETFQIDALTLTEKKEVVNAPSRPSRPSKTSKSKAKKATNEKESIPSPHLSMGKIYDIADDESEINMASPLLESEEDTKKTKTKKKPRKTLFKVKKTPSNEKIEQPEDSHEQPKMARSTSIPELDSLKFFNSSRGTHIDNKPRAESEAESDDEYLPDDPAEFFAQMDKERAIAAGTYEEPKPKKIDVPVDEVTDEEKKEYEKYVFDLVMFYMKVDPTNSNPDEKSRKLLKRYPPGNVAIALEKKYGDIPNGWEPLLEEAQTRLKQEQAV